MFIFEFQCEASVEWGGTPINHILGAEELEIPLEHKVISRSVIIVMIFFADFAIKSLFPFLLFSVWKLAQRLMWTRGSSWRRSRGFSPLYFCLCQFCPWALFWEQTSASAKQTEEKSRRGRKTVEKSGERKSHQDREENVNRCLPEVTQRLDALSFRLGWAVVRLVHFSLSTALRIQGRV